MLSVLSDRWIRTNQSPPYIKAHLIQQGTTNAVVQIYTSQTVRKEVVSIHDVYECWSGQPFDDMCQMKILNEPQILNNLIRRFVGKEVYTFIDKTLVFVNPYQEIQGLYSQKIMNKVQQSNASDKGSVRVPHVYTTINETFQNLKNNKNQVIVISGESGAGKTQNTKYCLKMLQFLTGKGTNQQITHKMEACNYILQVFGNARTSKNDNSSRFGKYLKIFINKQSQITGALLQNYLLQKSRVIKWGPDQRSFHIFYIDGQKNGFYNRDVRHNSCAFNKKQLNFNLSTIDFKIYEIDYIWGILKAIECLMSLSFSQNHSNQPSQRCSIDQKDLIQQISKILKIGSTQIEMFLLQENKILLKQSITVVFDRQNCQNNRNNLCKTIYSQIFQLLIKRMKKSLKGNSKVQQQNSISILDIFGFQDFQQNSLQQLCINYANQKLIKLYNDHIFKSQINMFEQDGIQTQFLNIQPPNNDGVVNALCGQISIFSIINDLTIPRQYTDADILQGIKSKVLVDFPAIKYNPKFSSHFSIEHSNCTIRYNVSNFKLKNQDKITDSIKEMTAKIIGNSFASKQTTILRKFKNQMNKLMEDLQQCQVNFIRCLKPNQNKRKLEINEMFLLNQIRYLGIFQSIQIRNNSFPFRETYQLFWKQYYRLMPTKKNNKQSIMSLLSSYAINDGYLIGRQRIYYDQRVYSRLKTQLNSKLIKQLQKIKIIQKFYRRYKERQNIINNLKLLIMKIQSIKNIPIIFLKVQKQSIARIKLYIQLRNKTKMIGATKLAESYIKIIKNKLNSSFLSIFKQQNDSLEKQKSQKPKSEQQNIKQNTNQTMPSARDHEPHNFIQKQLNRQSYSTANNHTVIADGYKSQNMLICYQTQKNSEHRKVFAGNLQIKSNESNINPNLNRLKAILLQTQNDNDSNVQLCPPSAFCNFTQTDIPEHILQTVHQMNKKAIFQSILRTRTNFLGYKKTYEEILVFKGHSISQPLTNICKQQQPRAIQVFKIILRICRESHIKQMINQIQQLNQICAEAPIELINQIVIQMMRQFNSSYELCMVRMLQLIVVFIYSFSPDRTFLLLLLSAVLDKVNREGSQLWLKQSSQMLSYCLGKIVRKIECNTFMSNSPTKYQIRTLIGRKQLSIVIALPTGRSIIVNADSNQTFKQIKQQALIKFGINLKRFPVQLFGFFQATTYNSSEIEQNPIVESQSVWGLLSLWQALKKDYERSGVEVNYRLMIKIKFAFSCSINDQQGILLCYSQCFFDYLIGRLRFQLQDMFQLAALAQVIQNFITIKESTEFIVPSWFVISDKDQAKQKIAKIQKQIREKQKNLLSLKYDFLLVCSRCSLSMATAIPTNQGIKIYLKPKKMFILFQGQIQQEYALKELVKWTGDSEKFEYEIMKKGQKENRTHAVFTDHSAVILDYLSTMSKLKTYSQPRLQSI